MLLPRCFFFLMPLFLRRHHRRRLLDIFIFTPLYITLRENASQRARLRRRLICAMPAHVCYDARSAYATHADVLRYVVTFEAYYY